MGAEGNTAPSACRPALSERLPVRRHLSDPWQGCSAHAAMGQHRNNAAASRRDQQSSRQRSSWCGAHGPGRMAHHGQTQNAEEPDHHSAAIALAGTEPGGEHLAVHARQLAFKPRLRKLRCHPGSWLRRMEQADRPTRNHHLNRIAKMGAHRSILIAAGIIRRLDRPCA